ncbi:MAG: 3-phosphoshikimate 1-carboxyvinyltransferase [Flavobacteriales bacterium]|nr:3-phosphoshikimate 1-carboxyvinyltransferase [Flavobacteriales bacterium]
MPRITIRKPEGPIRATVHLPRSKSVSNRALIAASLAGDLSCIDHLSEADDTRILYQLLHGKPRVLDCGLGGTTFRFLLAWACVQVGKEHVVTGDPKLLERPHDDLIHALRVLGAMVERTEAGYLVKGGRMEGGTITFDSPISSQYLSALMLIAPIMDKGLRIEWRGTQLSRPYVEMTAKTMRHFGAEVEVGETLIDVNPGRYAASLFEVPADWSAAAFWYEIVALADDAEVELMGLERDGWQGDQKVARILANWAGTLDRVEGVRVKTWMPEVPKSLPPIVDLRSTPDLFQPLAFTMAALGRSTTFAGLDNLASKESDRIAAVAETLSMMGVHVVRHERSVTIQGALRSHDVTWSARNDHRMAMALAPLALVLGSITIDDPDVVTKSYPGFWEDLQEAGFEVDRSDA